MPKQDADPKKRNDLRQRVSPKREIQRSAGKPGRESSVFPSPREESAFRRAIEESILSGIAAFDTEGRQTYANPAFCRMVGWSAEELLGKEPPFVFWPGEERETAPKAFRKILEGGKPRGSLEFRFQRRNGERFDTLLLYSELTDEQGRRKGWVMSASDFTQQKQAEEKMRRVNAELEERVRWRTAGLESTTRKLEEKVAEHKKMEERIAHLASFPELNPNPVVEIDRSGQVVYGNPAARGLFPDLAIQGTRHPYLAGVATLIGAPRNQKDISLVREQEVAPSWYHQSIHYSSVWDRIRIYGFDITNQKRAEAAIRDSEREFRELFEGSRDGYAHVDLDGNFLEFNESFQKMIGYEEEELKRLSYLDLTPQEWHEMEADIIQNQVLPYGYSKIYEKEYRRKDGTVLPVSLRTYLFQDGKGNPRGMWAFVRDITEPKRMEEELRRYRDGLEILIKQRTAQLSMANQDLQQKETLLRNVLESLPVGVWITDPQGRIIQSNPAGREIWGGARDVGIGQCRECKSWWVDTGKPIKAEEWALDRAIRKGDTSLNEEIEIECFDGTRKIILISAIPLRNDKNEITGALVITNDITERRSTEQRIRQIQKMEALGTLAGGIAHDFNNILMPIVINTELALLDLKKGILPSAQYMELVEQAATRGQGLVKQIITFSRQREQPRQPVDLNPVIKEALKFLRASIPTNIEIRSSIEVDPAVVLADPTQIHQVLMNLCSNAAFAMRDRGGILQATLARVEVSPESAGHPADLKPGPYLRLTVSDTGHGMDPEVKDRAFDPFFTTKKPGEGTGMGLAVVHGIVKSHEGTLTLESDLGKGTTVHVFLPRVQALEPREPILSGPIPTGKERILFVDDEEMQVQTLQHMLERLGYQVIAKTRAPEALDTFKTQPEAFDLVITDQTMPGMTGADLAREVLQIRPDMPVILYTGYSETFDEEQARSIGIREFALKPLTVRDMAERIRRALKK
jgi:PAS domain S-box-containing protein